MRKEDGKAGGEGRKTVDEEGKEENLRLFRGENLRFGGFREGGKGSVTI